MTNMGHPSWSAISPGTWTTLQLLTWIDLLRPVLLQECGSAPGICQSHPLLPRLGTGPAGQEVFVRDMESSVLKVNDCAKD